MSVCMLRRKEGGSLELKTRRELSEPESNAQLRLRPVSLTLTLSASDGPAGVAIGSVTISWGRMDVRMRASRGPHLWNLCGRGGQGPGL